MSDNGGGNNSSENEPVEKIEDDITVGVWDKESVDKIVRAND